MCLSESSTLRWFGSTESGAAVTLDSKGILRLYKISSRIWVPICDTQSFAKGASDTYYVVSVSLKYFN